MLDHPMKPYRQFGPETFSALALMLFSVPALVFSVFLTVLKFRTQYSCDGLLQSSCTSGCSTALSDSLSEIWGIPLSVFAAAFYFVLVGFALVVGLWPRDLAPAARFPVLVLGLGSLALSVFLGLSAWFVLDVVCEYCCLLYVASVGVFLSARLLNPEGVLFANPVAVAACAADCVAATAGFGIAEMFWCAGCQGGIYPFDGHVPYHMGGVRTAALIAQRLTAKMHRELLAWGWHGRPGLCGPYFLPAMDKTAYKTQLTYPVANTAKDGGRCCQPFGRSTIVWGAGKEYPVRGEDFAFMLFRKRNCCVGY